VEESRYPNYQSSNDTTSQSLVDAMQNGESLAWEKIAKVWGTTLMGYFRRKDLQVADCEEITQNVLVKMYGAMTRGKFKRDGKSKKLKHWVYAIAENELRSFYSRFKNKPGSPGGDVHQDLLANLGTEDDSGSFEIMLVSGVLDTIQGDFEESTWEAFRLHHFDSLPATEIAQQMGIKPGTVRQKIFRVMQRLRTELDAVIVVDEAG